MSCVDFRVSTLAARESLSNVRSDEAFFAAQAITDGMKYIRTVSHSFCFGE